MGAVKVYGLCVVKNEDDIIAQTLTFATRYCDRIFVLDNGSTDETWRIVQALGSRNAAIVPFRRTDEPFQRGLRGTVYNAVRNQLSHDDWWLVLDADEFLAEDPRPIIDAADAAGADTINTWQVQFYFTDCDLQSWEQGQDSRDTPIFDRRRHYVIDWQEPRLFRNDPRRDWDGNVSRGLPQWLTRLHKRRILNRHYQYRDPVQIDKRLRLRYGHPTCFSHVRSADWRSVIRSSRELSVFKDGDPWHFSPRGVFHYYRLNTYGRIRAAWQGGAIRRVRRLWKDESRDVD
jgi:glycosyltransferase involved in cell wall biosynthesis